MGDVIEHNCGLVVTHDLHDAHAFIRSLRHRGRDAVGIAAIGEETIDVIKWRGTTYTFDLENLHNLLPTDKYHTYMAHTRYKTRGSIDALVNEAHPHVIGGARQVYGESHIVIRGADAAIVHNGQINAGQFNILNNRTLLTACDSEALLHLYLEYGELGLLKNVPGSFVAAIADKNQRAVIVIRDKFGIKPGCLGRKDGKYAIASESIAFDKNGGEFIEDLDPGTVYRLFPDGTYTKQRVVSPEPQFCFFEGNYFGNVGSTINRIATRTLREVLGEKLAEEYVPDDVDLVSYVPRCPEVAARSYADKIDLPLVELFYKMRDERSFQGASATERKNSINSNLYMNDKTEPLVRGKRVLVIDDSLVRGNVALRVGSLLKNAGAEKIYFLSYTPPIGVIGEDGKPRGCEFGVDMPLTDNFIARGKTLEQISAEVGMQVHFLSTEKMLEAYQSLGMNPKNLCTFCIGGKHPFE
ncbi:MAG TPA: hypothetical protein VJK51_04445 [Candidatus Nanoarchaeia archaeon]|nr:hypothetical protein [Candidatus Nanoarchaeia archaeon]